MTAVRVLIVDDHDGFRAAATSLLTTSDFEVVGSVADGESVVAAVHSLTPDVVLVDVQLPGIDGVEVAEILHRLPDAPAVILISSRDDAADDERIRRAPVLGFLAKRDLDVSALEVLLP
jgi:DNA-binding NarL/FixJ family response regulator